MIYLRFPELIHVAERTLGQVLLRDAGLLGSACARPRTTFGGVEAYSTLEDKAASLLHSLVRNHALVDGNKRLGLAATIASLGINGRRLTLSNDEAYDLVIAVAAGELDDVPSIGERIRDGSTARRGANAPTRPTGNAWNRDRTAIPAL